MKNQKTMEQARIRVLSNVIQKHALFLMLALSVTLSACEEKEPEPEIVANAGPDQQIKVMETVALDGTKSRVATGATASFKWEFVKKPINSAASITGPTTAQPTFIADASGEFELELTVSDGTTSSTDRVMITAAQIPPIIIDKDITDATTLEDRIASPDFPDYIVSKDVAVKAALTLHPGVVIAFARDSRFTIADNGGVLIAKGTAERKIRFIGQQPTKGFWQGIMLNSQSTANVLEFVEIMHAGSQTMLDGTKIALAMFIESQAAFKNCLFAENDGYGMFVQEGAVILGFVANKFLKNTQAGIVLPADHVALLDEGSVFTGQNGRDVVEVIGAYLGKPTKKEEIIWKGFNDKTPYRLMNQIAVRTGWKLNPGVTVEATTDAAIIIDETAYLIAKGTQINRITFTGSAKSKAAWPGMLVHSKSQQNLLQYAEISNGGNVSLVSSASANLLLYGDGARMTVKNTRIAGSGGYGIWIGSGSIINDDLAAANEFEDNSSGNVGGK